MFVLNLARRIRNRIFASLKRLDSVSEEQDLADDLDRLDREQPGWDYAGRVAACTAALRDGLPKDIISQIYGSDVVREAEEAVANDQHN